MVFSLISSMFFSIGLLDQLQFFWQLCIRELVGILTGLATEAVARDISKAFDRVWHASLLHKLMDLMEFQVRYLVLLLLSSVISCCGWFWMESFLKNIQLELKFLKSPFFVLHFSYYTLMTFLMVLPVILLSVLMMLLSTLNVIKCLICGSS